MKPQPGWEAARAAGLQCGGSVARWDGLARRQSGAGRLRGRAAARAAPNPFPQSFQSFPPSPWLFLLWHSKTPAVPCPLRDRWDVPRDHLRRKVRSVLRGLLLPEIFGLKSSTGV